MSNDNVVEEETKAVYFQFVMQGELGTMATNLAIGARYEKTDVTSTAVILVPTALLWQDDNDFQVQRPTETTPFGEDADYDNLLPNLDFDIAITDTLKGRFSYSKTIARASYGQLAAGATVGGPGGSTLNGFQAGATANNPALLPLESDNFDLALEWYFSDTGYASVGFFEKRVSNFIGNSVDDGTLYGIRDQTGGPDAQFVLDWLKTNGHGTDDSSLFTALAMYRNPATGGLAAYDGTAAQHIDMATRFDILPTAADPEYVFGINRPVNNKEAKIHGWEVGGQYFFGDTGFGVLANYTIVRGDVGYEDDSDPNENQFALSGLSDSANAVLMFEKWGFSARLAYNWRDKFLASVNRGTWRNPVYVAEHKQFDLSVGYDLNDHLSFSLEGINLTGEDLRTYGRSEKQLWYLEDDGPRYAVGARYKF
jgi:TonB-dependent receptor